MILAIGLAVGAVVGLTGAGGSVLAVPLLVLLAGVPLAKAAPVALMAVGAAAALGSALTWKRRLVRWRAALLMGVSGMAAAPLGLHAAARVPESWLAWTFGAVALAVSVRMIRQGFSPPAPPEGRGVAGAVRVDTTTGRVIWTPLASVVLALIGGLAGFIGGLLGVGGGFLLVPALRAMTPFDMHTAVATAVLVVAVTACGTTVIHALGRGAPPLALAGPLAGGTLMGMLAGRSLAPRLPAARLQAAFAAALCVAAVALILVT